MSRRQRLRRMIPAERESAHVGDKGTIQTPGCELRHLCTDVHPHYGPTAAPDKMTDLARTTAKIGNRTSRGFDEVAQHRLILWLAVELIEECGLVLARHRVVRRRNLLPGHAFIVPRRVRSVDRG